MDSVISLHESYSETIVNKFSIFCAANSQMPYSVKKKVFDAAVTSALLYSCESWIANNIKGIERQYNKLIKCLLGVRKNTSINLCMVEVGIPPVKDIIDKQRKSYLQSKLEDVDLEQPFHYVYNMCRNQSTPGYKILSSVLRQNVHRNPLETTSNYIREKSNNVTKLHTCVDVRTCVCVFVLFLFHLHKG